MQRGGIDTSEFNLQTLIEVIAQVFFSGSLQLAGLAVLLAAMLIFVVVFAALNAPVQYSLIPCLILSLFFSSYGIIDMSVSFILVIVTAVLVAGTAKDMITGGKRSG